MKGFTFIEFLIYGAILSLVVFAMGSIMINVLRIQPRGNAVLEVTYNGRFAMQRMGQYINQATTAEIEPGGNQITLSGFADPDKNPTTFRVTGGVLKVREGLTGQWIDLTTQKVRVDSLNFERVSSPYLDSIKIEMNISFYNPEDLAELDFSSFFRTSFVLSAI